MLFPAHLLALAVVAVVVHQGSVAAPAPHNADAQPDPNDELWNADSNIVPQAIRGSKGATVIGPHNIPVELQNPDLLAPPSTDHGRVPNLKWPFALSANRLYQGGWVRGQNVDVLPAATEIAGANMRLEAGAIRELHWHSTAEWTYVVKGDVRISTVTPDGEVFVGDVSEGDLWYFPAGYPHSLQAKNSTKEGAEFILVFDDGTFGPDSTFLLTDWLAHTPKGVLAKNFGFQDLKLFDHIPKEELFIFPSSSPLEDISSDMAVPNDTPNPFTFALSKVKPTKQPGGSVKIVDTRTFNVSKKISAVEVTVKVGGIRELHWHPTQPEWTYFISGEARVTIYAGHSNAQTFDFSAGDVGYVPPSFGHYVENVGKGTLKFLEVFKSDLVEDISLTQWLALTPPALVKAHLGFSKETIAKLSKTKHLVAGGT